MKFLGKVFMEISTVLVAVVSVLLGVIFIPIGAIYTMSKPFYDYKGKSFKVRMKMFGLWFLKVLYQFWVVIRYIFLQVGYIIDLFGNVLVGELIEDIVTASEDTMFGKGGITISAALGDLKKRDKLNKRGLWTCKVLSWIDSKHDDHCGAAINLYEYKISQQSKK
jgi:hypothetical protein